MDLDENGNDLTKKLAELKEQNKQGLLELEAKQEAQEIAFKNHLIFLKQSQEKTDEMTAEISQLIEQKKATKAS